MRLAETSLKLPLETCHQTPLARPSATKSLATTNAADFTSAANWHLPGAGAGAGAGAEAEVEVEVEAEAEAGMKRG